MRSMGYGFVVAVCLVGAARADVISQSAAHNGSDAYGGDAFFSFSDFDGSLGTLTGVSIALSYNALDSFWLQANAAGALAVTFKPHISLTDGSDFIAPPPPPVIQNLLFQPDTFFGPNAHTVVSVTGSATFIGNPANFYAFKNGLGQFVPDEADLDIWTMIGTDGVFIVGTDTGHSFQTFATIDVTYTYTPTDPSPVPEPASILVLGLGALGVAAVGRKLAR